MVRWRAIEWRKTNENNMEEEIKNIAENVADKEVEANEDPAGQDQYH